MTYPFGNDPAKTRRYREFWDMNLSGRPLVGFTFKGWLPVEEYRITSSWPLDSYLTPDMVDPADFLADQDRMIAEGERMDDDIIRGGCPHQGIPWNCAVIGGELRILPGSLLAEDKNLQLEEIPQIRTDASNPWMKVYLEYVDALIAHADGAYPVSHGCVVGPTDLAVILHGHTNTAISMMDGTPGIGELFEKMGDVFTATRDAVWDRIPLWQGGYYDAQYYLWAPGPIARLQEDALPIFSPTLYRKYVQHIDAAIAERYAYTFMHLHSTSMFVLDELLEIRGIKAFEVNNDVGGPPVSEMIPHIRKIQESGRPVIFRGAFTPEEMRLIVSRLDCSSLYLHIMVEDMGEVEPLKKLLGM